MTGVEFAQHSATQDTKAITINNAANVFVTSLGYDALDRVITTTYHSTGEVVTQTYNNLGALENMRSVNLTGTLGSWYVKNLDYNARGALTLAQLGNSVNTTYTYDPLNFRLQQLLTSGPQTLQDLKYRYDKVGNVLTITDTASFSPTKQYQTFTYDSLDRLNTAVVTGAVTGTYSETYTYNAIGNITNTSRLGNYVYTATAASCVTGTPGNKPHAVTRAGSQQYAYDCNGNMKTRVENGVTYTQTWDVENRLVAVTSTVSAAKPVNRFTYDGDGSRVLQVQISGTQVTRAPHATACGAVQVSPPPTPEHWK